MIVIVIVIIVIIVIMVIIVITIISIIMILAILLLLLIIIIIITIIHSSHCLSTAHTAFYSPLDCCRLARAGVRVVATVSRRHTLFSRKVFGIPHRHEVGGSSAPDGCRRILSRSQQACFRAKQNGTQRRKHNVVHG